METSLSRAGVGMVEQEPIGPDHQAYATRDTR